VPPLSVITIIFLSMAASYGLLYIFARTYIPVECFISFAYLPDTVLQRPSWIGYFPHIQSPFSLEQRWPLATKRLRV
jgi:hypothetical protein